MMKNMEYMARPRAGIWEERRASGSAFAPSFPDDPFISIRHLLAVFPVYIIFGVG